MTTRTLLEKDPDIHSKPYLYSEELGSLIHKSNRLKVLDCNKYLYYDSKTIKTEDDYRKLLALRLSTALPVTCDGADKHIGDYSLDVDATNLHEEKLEEAKRLKKFYSYADKYSEKLKHLKANRDKVNKMNDIIEELSPRSKIYSPSNKYFKFVDNILDSSENR